LLSLASYDFPIRTYLLDDLLDLRISYNESPIRWRPQSLSFPKHTDFGNDAARRMTLGSGFRTPDDGRAAELVDYGGLRVRQISRASYAHEWVRWWLMGETALDSVPSI
jgi:hypothetical protein